MNRLQAVPSQRGPLRAALYGRASKDRFKRGTSIRDQFAEGRTEAASRGWTIVGEYEDRDRSASSRATKTRENYERMVQDVESGMIDVIVYAERSRANRTLDGYVQLRSLCLRTGVLWCYDGRVYDLSKAADRRETARDAVEAEGEADTITDRNNRTVRQGARRGWMHGPVAFGFKRVYDSETGHLVEQIPHPAEAPVLRQLFANVDAGKSLRSQLAFVRPLRPLIAEPGLRVMLTNRAYIGIRVHGDDEYPAAWPGLIDEDVFWRVQARLAERQTDGVRTAGVVHLMTGLALCGICRRAEPQTPGRVTARGPAAHHRRRSQYRCKTEHLVMFEDLVDAVVEESLLTFLGSKAARLALTPKADDGQTERERVKLKAMKDQLEEAQAQATTFDSETGMPLLSAASLGAMEVRLLPMIKESEQAIRDALSVGDALVDQLMRSTPDELEELWEEELDIEQKRHVIHMLMRVELLPAPRMGREVDPASRVNMIFVGEAGFAEWPKMVAVC